ncbi:MAG: hypothetical protein UU09_C0048G0011 [Microgenomates group bacterium GW2011_GWA2_40_6]|nr:MAG: hypothetical protein UU09_C0048G0011 [Microgenomates group bacterium GW2011_GWA2_40_6]
MDTQTYKVLSFILKICQNKKSLFFWFIIRFLSAILPLVTIYQFSGVVKLLEQKAPLESVVLAVFLIFLVRVIDNFPRLRSITKLEYEIAAVSFDIHNFFLSDLKTSTKSERHEIVQAIRNFADASSTTLNLIKQPGIDSFVSILFIPVILLFLNFPAFILNIAYIAVYYATDYYTTQRYAHLKNILNTRTEVYYAKLQDSNDFNLEQKSWSRHFRRLVDWGNIEWNLLQNTAVIFYSLILFLQISEVVGGNKQISDLVLVMGYITQTQVYLNSFSSIKDSLTDMLVGLNRLASNPTVSTVDLDDLI